MTQLPTPPARPEGRSTRRWPAAGAAVVLLLGAGLVGYVLTRGDVPRGVHVLGVDVGGMTREEAAAALRRGLDDRSRRPVAARVGQTTVEITPQDVGLRVDVPATVERAASEPSRFGPSAFTGQEVSPVVVVDPAQLAARLRARAGSAVAPAVLPEIRYEGLTPVPTYASGGTQLDATRTAEAFQAGWLRHEVIDVPTKEAPPSMTRQEVDAVVEQLAEPAVSAPVVADAGTAQLVIPPRAIAAALALKPGPEGKIAPRVDPVALREQLGTALQPLAVAPRNASIVLRNGAPAVVPHVDGRAVDVPRLATDLLGVLGRREAAARRLTAVIATTPPQLTTAAAQQLGVTVKVSSFTTRFAAGPARTVNIKRMADLLDGRLVRPGETFSLNGSIGERTPAKGFVEAPYIATGGVLKNSSGGGVSQVATTLFNAMYHAGLEDIQHQPHSYYFSRYPSVLEATVSWPRPDLKFRNDSPYGVLVDTSHTATSVTVSLWSTKRYDIRTVYGPRTNPTRPRTVHLPDEDCLPTDGLPGFQQDAWRVFLQNGKEIKRQRFSWRYSPEPKFICDHPAAKN
jgi:vancomycin resistance protein YoaR